MKRVFLFVAILVVLSMIIAPASAPLNVAAKAPEPQGKELVVYHWWTAGGEQQAMNKSLRVVQQEESRYQDRGQPHCGRGGITLKTVLLGLFGGQDAT